MDKHEISPVTVKTSATGSGQKPVFFDNGDDYSSCASDPRIGEAVEIYGDIHTAEDLGYVTRGLKSRHIQFIALGGTIGTGLFLGINRAFMQAGPLSLFLGYSITGVAIWAMMQCLGEMATWLPLPGAIPQFCSRYVDSAMGFAVGWTSWYQSTMTVCTEISAAAVVISFWKEAQDINPAAWITVIIVLILMLNLFAVSIYGETEFWFASLKIIAIIGLILFAFIVDLGGSPKHDRLGFRYWNNPGAMKPYLADGASGRFLGLWSTLVNAAFAYGGIETFAVAAGEAENPRRNLPKAVRRVFSRILFFYVIGSLAIGVLIPYNDPWLLEAQKSHAPGAAASPWVIAIRQAGVPVLPSVVNIAILLSAISCANAFLYMGSRYLFALAQNGQAPRFLLRCSKRGVPYYAIICTASISLLTYMSCSKGATQVFIWFQNLVTISYMFIWMSVAIAYLRFRAALQAQGVDRRALVFQSAGQPYTAWFCLVFFALVTVFNGFWVFPSSKKRFDVSGFVTSYVGVPIYFGLYAFWKVVKRTTVIRPQEADIHTGKAALDAIQWKDPQPRNWMERVWYIVV